MSRSVRTSLITGGAGFIGSHLVDALLARGERVVVVDDLSTGRRENLFGADSPANAEAAGPARAGRGGVDLSARRGLTFIERRVGDTLAGRPELVSEVDRIFHLAASVGVKLIVDRPIESMRNNLEETARLLEAASAASTPVLLASSSEVYGKSARVPMSEDHDLTFGPTTSARWSYGLSKAIDEHLALSHHRLSGLPVVVARLFNTIGPRQRGSYGMVAPRFVARAVAGEPIEVFGDGSQTRAFCDVRDVARALIELMQTPEAVGRVFNVGDDRELRIDALAERVIALSESSSTLRYVPFDRAYNTGLDDLQRRAPDLTRLRQTIRFEPQYTLDQTLGELIAAARESEHAVTGGRTT